MKSLQQIFWISLLTLIAFKNQGQNALDYQGFFFKSSMRKQTTFPFKQANNLIIIPLVMNRGDTLNFILDTGVNYTLISSPAVAEKLQLPRYRSLEIYGADKKRTIKAYISYVDEIFLDVTRATKHGVLVLEEDITDLSENAGMEIHGLIGNDIFSHFIVKIDYLEREITLFHPEKYKFKAKRNWQSLEVEFINAMPHVIAEVRTNTTSYEKVKLLIDTGAGHALLLETKYNNLTTPANCIQTHLGNALGGAIYGKLGRVENFSIGNFELASVLTSFPENSDIIFSEEFLQERQGSIGYGILKRFDLVFDFLHHKIWLKPNENFKKPFRHTTSGIYLTSEAPDYKTFKIAYMCENSPAENAGLQVGDILLFINKTPVSQLNISNIYDLLEQESGKTVTVFVQRGQEVLQTQLVLQEIL